MAISALHGSFLTDIDLKAKALLTGEDDLFRKFSVRLLTGYSFLTQVGQPPNWPEGDVHGAEIRQDLVVLSLLRELSAC